MAVKDDEFLESLYVTLASRGMHRIGPQPAKLRDFESFSEGFLRHRDNIRALENTILADVADAAVEDLIARLWTIVSGLRVSPSDTQIVAGSKALHHVLPELVPPIDREYTDPVFLRLQAALSGSFRTIVGQFRTIACAADASLTSFCKAQPARTA